MRREACSRVAISVERMALQAEDEVLCLRAKVESLEAGRRGGGFGPPPPRGSCGWTRRPLRQLRRRSVGPKRKRRGRTAFGRNVSA